MKSGKTALFYTQILSKILHEPGPKSKSIVGKFKRPDNVSGLLNLLVVNLYLFGGGETHRLAVRIYQLHLLKLFFSADGEQFS